MDIISLLLVIVIVGYFVYAYNQREKIQQTISSLFRDLRNAYLAAFLDPQNHQKLEQHEEAHNKLKAFVTQNANNRYNQTGEYKQHHFDNQQKAILLHMQYLNTLSAVIANLTDNELYDSFISISQDLKAHLNTTALSNKAHFIESHSRNVILVKHTRYRHALELLKQSPDNSDMHIYALKSGREYAESTREQGLVTIFDETALANDIRAVTANASQVSAIGDTSVPASPATATASLDERIAKLLKLKAAGLLSDAEFEQKRQALIDEV